MDIFFEKLVKKKKDIADYLFIAAILVLCIIIIGVGFVFSPQLIILVLFGTAYGGWYLITTRDIEFEYIITNNELDIDKIVAQRKRSRILTVDVKKFDVLAPVSKKYENDINNKAIKNKLYFCSSKTSENLFFAIFNDGSKGRTILFFEPDKRMLEAISKINPKKVELA